MKNRKEIRNWVRELSNTVKDIILEDTMVELIKEGIVVYDKEVGMPYWTGSDIEESKLWKDKMKIEQVTNKIVEQLEEELPQIVGKLIGENSVSQSHIREKKTTYFKHWKMAMKLSIASFIHGWFPNILKDYVSTHVCKKDEVDVEVDMKSLSN